MTKSNQTPQTSNSNHSRKTGDKKMSIGTLKELKDALITIQDKDLELLGFGWGEECEEVGLVVWDDNFPEIWAKFEKKYPQLDEISSWMKNILKAQKYVESGKDNIDLDAPISSNTDIFDEDEKSSSIQQTAEDFLKDKLITNHDDAYMYGDFYKEEDVLKALELKEQEVLASLKAELEGKSGADMLNETIIRTIEEPRKIEEAKQQAKRELLKELRDKGCLVICDTCGIYEGECKIKKRHNLK